MTDEREGPTHQKWASFRFAVVGPLLASPPARGELSVRIAELVERIWQDPVSGKPRRFGASTIERWYYQAKNAGDDPVSVLRRRIRKDSGGQPGMTAELREALVSQYEAHKGWSCQLHSDNLAVLAEEDRKLGRMPSYSTVRRFMKRSGLVKRTILRRDTEGARAAVARLETREVRSYEAEYVHGLWHLDFHETPRKVLTSQGVLEKAVLFGMLDDRSRLCCHLQWYIGEENAEDLVHGFSQGIQKRELPRALMTDNGPAMRADEVKEGLERLGITHEKTLEYSPYQNAKQEVFWAQVEGRLLAMLEGVSELSIGQLNEASQAWVEMEYNRKVHSETRQTPLERFLQGPSVGRECPGSDALRLAFTARTSRTQRRSDGTISLEGIRFEIPNRYRTLQRVMVRYAGWDLAHVYLVDERADTVLCPLYPLDKVKNADGVRRPLTPILEERAAGASNGTPKETGMAPLLKKLLSDYAATGLPPAYLPKEERTSAEEPS